MIRLFQFPSYWGMPNVSPFCMKLETYLRMAGLPYQIVKCADPRKAPKGKLPYIEDKGRVIADSSIIISYLMQQYGDVLDTRLSPLQKAQTLALQRMIEEHLYWCIVYSRWLDTTNWPLVKRAFFSRLPFLTRDLIAGMVRRHTRSELHMHGMGRHTQEEIYQSGCDDLAAISAILGEQSFMTGAEPASIDAVAYAFIANILYVPTISTMLDYVKSQKNLVDYCERMKQRFYS